MKKLNPLPAFLLLAVIFTSCSKEPLEYESPYQADKSFYFTMEMGRSRPTSYGFEDLNNKTKWGPAMSITQDNDPAKLSTTIKVNNKFGIPKEMQGDLLIDFVLTKKGTDPIGKYGVLQGDVNGHVHILDRTTERSYKIHKDSLVFDLTLVARSTLFGKYAEGKYSMNLVDIKDTSKVVPVTGSFRLHMAE
jgi:uncharacterized protein (DUF2249 family)